MEWKRRRTAFAVSIRNGSASRTRTYDPVINSHLLYQLSYRGTASVAVRITKLFRFAKPPRQGKCDGGMKSPEKVDIRQLTACGRKDFLLAGPVFSRIGNADL